MNPLNLFQRAHRRLPLSPEERALLKFTYLALGTAAITGFSTVVQYIGSNGKSINWQVVFYVFLSAFSLSLYETGRKWVSANGDGPLGAALQLVTEATKRAGVTKQAEQLMQPVQPVPSEPAQGGASGVSVAGDTGVR